MVDAAFVGQRDSNQFVTNAVEENWRKVILMMDPNGDAPLTGLTSQMKGRELKEGPLFHWWTQNTPSQKATVTGLYIDAGLGTAYVYVTHQATYGIAGQTVYVKGSAAQIALGRVGNTVLLRDASRSDVDVRGLITAKQINSTSSYWAVRLLEADDNSATAATYNLASVDTALIYGNAQPEGSSLPESILMDPTQFDGYCQIFRNSLNLTRTAYRTNLGRTGQDPYKEAKRQALLYHGLEMEKSFFWGIKLSTTGDNGKPLRYCQGVIDFIREGAALTVPQSVSDDFTLNTDYSGDTWVAGGSTWLNEQLEKIFRYGSKSKMAFCGSGALLGINKIAESLGTIQLTPGATKWGMKVKEWMTPFGDLTLKTHPLFSYEATDRYRIVIMEPEYIKYVYVDDTFYQEDPAWQNGGQSSVDAINEGYLTECGLELGNYERYGMLNGIGQDNALS